MKTILQFAAGITAFLLIIAFVIYSQRVCTGLSREEVFKRLDILPEPGDTIRLAITDKFPIYSSDRLVYVFKNDTLVSISEWETQELNQEER